ncbi:MAG: hypothetical protein JNK37_22780 [Verrucomicrobiales bacterium]|nr:hypothetical protein [Verrucomicrobiales bacterium]
MGILPLDRQVDITGAVIRNALLGHMSAVASVTFDFDGTDNNFQRLYDAISDLDLDIAAYSEGTTGIIEFMIDDFSTFKKRVAKRSADLGINLVARDHVLNEPKT